MTSRKRRGPSPAVIRLARSIYRACMAMGKTHEEAVAEIRSAERLGEKTVGRRGVRS